jgi:hypothetical protein
MSNFNEASQGGYITPQERWFLGGGSEGAVKEHYAPEGVLSGKASIEAVRGARKQLGYVEGGGYLVLFGKQNGMMPGESIRMRLQDIDPVTGQTVKDPEIIVGIWDEARNEFVGDTRDLTEEFCASNEEGGEDLHLRTERGKQPEIELGGDPEKG